MKLDKLQALAMGALVGFLAASAPSCGKTTGITKCDSTTCATGCCDDFGVCVKPEAQSNDFCGTSAVTCEKCTSGKVCSAGACRINGGDGGTGGGTGGGSAGTGGGSSADAGPCGPSTCNGCCDTNGRCQAGSSPNSCGLRGGQCARCAFGQACQADAGACVAAPCSGCRDALGNCIGGANNNNACGSDGGICKACNTTFGQSCVAGSCTGGTCDPSTCADGCCSGSTCVTAQTPFQCGKGGVMCVGCNGNDTCNAQTGLCEGTGAGGGAGGAGGGSIFPGLDGGLFGTCDATSCSNGCCGLGLVCFGPPPQGTVNQSFIACGTGGADCITCPISFPLKQCINGMCQ